MPYRFALERRDYSDFASGRFLYGLPGQPALPVRLTSEIFQRARAQLEKLGVAPPFAIYDPCCGGAYHLATLGYLHGGQISHLIASDVDETVLKTAVRNLSLLTPSGWQRRMDEIEELQTAFGKLAHSAAAKSGARLGALLKQQLHAHDLSLRSFVADGTSGALLAQQLDGQAVDMVIADVPYGIRTHWSKEEQRQPVLWQLLDALTRVTHEKTAVAIVADKAQKCDHRAYQRLERFQIGKRRITILQRLL